MSYVGFRAVIRSGSYLGNEESDSYLEKLQQS